MTEGPQHPFISSRENTDRPPWQFIERAGDLDVYVPMDDNRENDALVIVCDEERMDMQEYNYTAFAFDGINLIARDVDVIPTPYELCVLYSITHWLYGGNNND